MNQEILAINLNQTAEFYLSQGKLEIAYEICQSILADSPNFSPTYNTQGKVLQAMGKIESAITSYRQAIQLNPQQIETYKILGDILVKQEKLSEAIACYETAIKHNPKVSIFHHKLGLVFIQLKNWDEAVNAFCRAIQFNPNFPWSYYKLGEALTQQKKWHQAVIAYQRAIEIKPDLYWSYQHLGNALRKQRKIEEAITCYRKAIEIKSDGHQFYHLLGDVLLETGQSEEAIACYIKAIKLQPDATTVYAQLRGIYTFKLAQLTPHQLNELVKCYQESIKLLPNFPEAYINLADILTEKGELDTAINYYQKATYNKLLVSHPEFVKNHWYSQQLSQPSFMIIGTVKGGTSSLYSYLCHHPNVIPPLQKEINFFSKKLNRGIDWYLAHFPQLPLEGKFITGEATPNYMYSEKAGKKLLENFPKIKIIAILRNPVDRTVSQFYMAKCLGQESKKFTEFVPQEIQILTELNNNPQNYQRLINKMSIYFRRSLYIHFLKKWVNIFPKEQLLILKSEDMYENPAAITKQVFDFLGLPDYQLLEYKNYFPGSYPEIDASLRHQLSELFQPHNQKLEEYLGMKFNWE